MEVVEYTTSISWFRTDDILYAPITPIYTYNAPVHISHYRTPIMILRFSFTGQRTPQKTAYAKCYPNQYIEITKP